MENAHLAALFTASNAGNSRQHRALLQSIVRTTQSVCAAQACSVQRLDRGSRELVFEAASGRGRPDLIGIRYSADTGIAGWTLVSRQAIVVDDVQQNAHFAKDVAESTGYLPRSIIALPLIHEDRLLGVLEVLDSSAGWASGIAGLDFLAEFAEQAAIVLSLVEGDQLVDAAVSTADEAMRELMEISGTLAALTGDRRTTALRLLHTLRELLG